MIMNKAYVRIIVLALVVLAVVLSGCLDAQLSTKVNRDFSGTRTMHLEMAPVLYTALESNLSRESFSSVNGADLVSYKKDIKDNKVILFSDKVPNPVAVHFSWVGDATESNLFNKEGFPAVPFRTDEWKTVTKGEKYKI